MVFTENIASLSTFRGQLSYAFNYEVNDLKAAIGVSTEIHNMRLSNDVIESELYDVGDMLASDLIDGVRVFDASVGFWASYKKDTYFGFSVPNLVRNKLDDISGEVSSFYFLATAGHKIHVKKYHFNFEPSFLVKKVRNVPLQLDLNAKAGFLKDKLITGLSLRTYLTDKNYPIIGGKGGALAILLGTTYKTLKIYYSFDVFFEQFQRYNSGSHELTFSFDFERKKTKKYDRSKKYRGNKKKK